MLFFSKVREVVWGRPADTKAERRLVVKLDLYIMTFVCLMYWVNYLDRSNLSNAYVSGLKEDLNMHSTELNQINSVFYVGYTLGRIPNNLALQKVPPHLYLSVAMIVWGLLTLGTAFVTSWHQVMVIRFFEAIFESATFVGTHYILGSWYNYEEIGTTTAVFAASGVAGNMFSGILQGAIHKNLDGLHGLAGWRWLFIVDFLITVPVACLGFFVFPGHPQTTKSKLPTPDEKLLAIERLPEPEKKRGKLGGSLLRRVAGGWEIYALSILAAIAGDTEMYADNSILALFFKYLGTYGVEEINCLPTAIYGIAIVSILCCSWYSDYFKNVGGRLHTGIFLGITAIISDAIMLNPPTLGAKFFALFLNGVQLGYRAVLFAWANDLMRNDDAKRGVVLGMMNAMTIAFYIFWSLLFYNTTQVPDWYQGSIAMIATGIAMIFSVISVWLFEGRDKRNAQVIEGMSQSDNDSTIIEVQPDKTVQALPFHK